ncbi:MAG: hypothetical protein WBA43_08375 [Elainellaceae cyanobacterium]
MPTLSQGWREERDAALQPARFQVWAASAIAGQLWLTVSDCG